MSPPNMPLWYKDYFQLQATENQSTKSSLPFPWVPEAGYTFPSEKGVCPVPEQPTLIIKDEKLTPSLVCINRTY